MTAPKVRTSPPQAFVSSYAPRIRSYGNALLIPVVQPATQLPPTRTTKRGTTAINYAEDGFDDEDFYDSEGPRRPTGLRSLRRDEQAADRVAPVAALGKELEAPVDLQGIWRDWMGKQSRLITERQLQVQSVLPLNLIPIRIDLDIPSFRPEAPLPAPANARDYGIDESLPAYRQPEPTPAYRLKDYFLWNLHEALITPDQFARKFVEELDFPNDRKHALTLQITNQIRQQLEEYAGVALHPLFHSGSTSGPANGPGTITNGFSTARGQTPASIAQPHRDSIDMERRDSSVAQKVTASAERASPGDDAHNPDDTYRCVVNLNVNLLNKLYSDKFEWSLLHPPGFAEHFAGITCADLGLSGEWVAAMSHAIYEAVLRLKKEVCENGGLLLAYGEMHNDAIDGEAGWRYDPEHLADDWEPKVEILSKEEIEKREGDRERQLRRVRRETARVSSTANINPGVGGGGAGQQDYFNTNPDGDQALGRGERSKKKRRFRSLSPVGRDTPDGAAAAAAAVVGYGGQSALRDDERQWWRCSHCGVWGTAVWAVRDGPNGNRTLCHNCGFLYERDKRLPPWSKDYFAAEPNPFALARR